MRETMMMGVVVVLEQAMSENSFLLLLLRRFSSSKGAFPIKQQPRDIPIPIAAIAAPSPLLSPSWSLSPSPSWSLLPLPSLPPSPSPSPSLPLLPSSLQQRNAEDGNGGLSLSSPETRRECFLAPGVRPQVARRLPWSNIFVAPEIASEPPAPVLESEFVKSSPSMQDCPKDGLLEIAVVGRSNVGKSTLINALLCRRNLAKTSKKPGKTQLINHFLVDKSWYLVDLPGYGFAQAPVGVRKNWDAFTREYFSRRETLVSVLLLVDATLPPKMIDYEYAVWLSQNKIPMTLVFTKCDKRKKRLLKPEAYAMKFLEKLKGHFDEAPPWVTTSCKRKQGVDELLAFLAVLRKHWKRERIISS